MDVPCDIVVIESFVLTEGRWRWTRSRTGSILVVPKMPLFNENGIGAIEEAVERRVQEVISIDG